MPIRVLTGTAGAGKTTEVIRIVNDHRERKERCFLVASLDGSFPRPSLTKFGTVGARNGRQARVDFKGSVAEAREFIRENSREPATFVFDEAHCFGDSFVTDWKNLSNAGSNVIVSTPSVFQLKELKIMGASVTHLKKLCDLLADGDATVIIRLPGEDGTISICEKCATQLKDYARKNLYERLIDSEPYPGKKEIYQPIDVSFSEYSELQPIRGDSQERVNIMKGYVDRYIGSFEKFEKSYVDIGCNTGFFCKKMADFGFKSTGVDVARNDIQMAKVADSYFYNRHINFICKDAIAYVDEDMDDHDVVSTFSVYQWIFTKAKDPELVYRSLQLLMNKTRKLFFFEMGYTKEEHYKDRLSININRDWCFKQMKDLGNFSEIELIEEGARDLKRDFFVGIK